MVSGRQFRPVKADDQKKSGNCQGDRGYESDRHLIAEKDD